MKKLLFVLAVIILLIIAIVFLLQKRNISPAEVPGEFEGSSFTSSSTEVWTPPKSQEIPLSNQTVQPFTVRNFLTDGGVNPDQDNPGYYFLGSSYSDGEDSPYVITYQQQTNFFNIVLLKEPLKDSRAKAENYLAVVVGLSQDQMCALKYMVSTPQYVSDDYAGKDLKFSFCSGSTPL